LFVVVATCKLL